MTREQLTMLCNASPPAPVRFLAADVRRDPYGFDTSESDAHDAEMRYLAWEQDPARQVEAATTARRVFLVETAVSFGAKLDFMSPTPVWEEAEIFLSNLRANAIADGHVYSENPDDFVRPEHVVLYHGAYPSWVEQLRDFLSSRAAMAADQQQLAAAGIDW